MRGWAGSERMWGKGWGHEPRVVPKRWWVIRGEWQIDLSTAFAAWRGRRKLWGQVSGAE